MRTGLVMWMSGALLLGGVAMASARGERDLSAPELRAEMAANRAMARYIERNGPPNVAEAHVLSDRPPWDDHEVTLYYFDARKEIGFARAYILNRPSIQIVRYQRPLSDADIAALEPRSRKMNMSSNPNMSSSATPGEGPVARAEASAARAEAAADRVEAAAVTAEAAADRTEAVVAKIAAATHHHKRKSTSRAHAPRPNDKTT